jgi:hypothetical protein
VTGVSWTCLYALHGLCAPKESLKRCVDAVGDVRMRIPVIVVDITTVRKSNQHQTKRE